MPTVVGIVDKKVDTSYFYNINEEEEESISSFNEIKMVNNEFNFCFNLSLESNLISFFIPINENINCKYSSTILLPPPELI